MAAEAMRWSTPSRVGTQRRWCPRGVSGSSTPAVVSLNSVTRPVRTPVAMTVVDSTRPWVTLVCSASQSMAVSSVRASGSVPKRPRSRKRESPSVSEA